MSEDAASAGRARLAAWEAARPGNAFVADHNLQEALRMRLAAERYEALRPRYEAFGGQVARDIDPAARETNRLENLPRLRRYDGIGRRTENIVFHPDHHQIGRAVWASRVMADYDQAGRELEHIVFTLLLSESAEAGHACPLACTAGLIKIIQRAGDEALRARFLPGLLNPNYDEALIGSQFLTEVQGGSDVGANCLEARPGEDGLFRLWGEKWFCSVINADLFLMTARPQGARAGTRGLAAFAVPRVLEDGSPNQFRIRRLKDKMGTRSMASAEVDFEGAVGYPIGALDEGFRNVVETVLTTSRIYNAICCAGFMRRAQVEAFNYAQARSAFGQPILNFPLIQRTLAGIKCSAAAALAGTLELVQLGDRVSQSLADQDESQAFRALVIMNKSLTATQNIQTIHGAIEVFAGNGVIEDFSILPRLLRDAYILEAWEGTHNVLAAQLLRDLQRYRLDKGMLRWLGCQFSGGIPAALSASAEFLKAKLGKLPARFEALAGAGDAASLRLRDLSDEVMELAQGVALFKEARWSLLEGIESEKAELLVHHCVTRLGAQEDEAVLLQRIARLSEANPGLSAAGG